MSKTIVAFRCPGCGTMITDVCTICGYKLGNVKEAPYTCPYENLCQSCKECVNPVTVKFNEGHTPFTVIYRTNGKAYSDFKANWYAEIIIDQYLNGIFNTLETSTYNIITALIKSFGVHNIPMSRLVIEVPQEE